MAPRLNRKVWVVLRAFLSLLLLVLLFWKLDIRELAGLMRNAIPSYLALAFLCNLGVIFLTAYRWRVLLLVQDIPITLPRTLLICFVGFFFHNFLPTAVGFDVVRGLYAARESGKKAGIVASILADRFLGFLGLIAFILLALLLTLGGGTHGKLVMFIPASLVLLVLLSLLLVRREPLDRFRERVGKISLFSMGERMGRLLDSTYLYRDRKGEALRAIVASLFIQGLLVVDNFFIGLSLGLQVSPLFYLVHIPVIALISMVPITIGGLGVREGGYVLFFARAGLTSAQAISLSLFFFIIGVAGSLIGGVLFPVLKAERRARVG